MNRAVTYWGQIDIVALSVLILMITILIQRRKLVLCEKIVLCVPSVGVYTAVISV
jgi:hypothetical protein